MKLVLIRTFLILIAFLPLSINRALGSILGFVQYKLNSRDVKVSRRNIQLCFPDLSAQEQEKLILQSAKESMKCALESLWAWGNTAEKVKARFLSVRGLEHLKQLQQNNSAILLTGAHLGNWEALLNWIAGEGPCTIAYKEPKISGTDSIILNARQKAGVTMVPGNKSGLKQMFKVLENRGTFIILSDQKPGKRGGVFAPFFHNQAYTMTLVQTLVQKTSANLLFFFAKRIKGGFEVVIEPANFDTKEADPEQFSALMNKQLEQQIKSCPAQFEWSYRRFRPQPDNSVSLYQNLK